MKRLGTLLLYAAVFLLLVLFFLPKQALYYKAESLLKPYGVILSGETVNDTGFGLRLEGGTLYYEDLAVSTLGTVTLSPWLFYNSLDVGAVQLSSDVQAFVPGNIAELTVYYTVLDPLHLTLRGEGDFGSVSGSVDLTGRRALLELTPSAALRSANPFWLKQMKKTQGGTYRYETAY